MIESMTYCSTHGHRPSVPKFTIQNKCSYTVNPVIANTNCGYSPREFFRCSMRGGRTRSKREAHHLRPFNPQFGDGGSASHFSSSRRLTRADPPFFPYRCIPRFQGCNTPGSGGVPNPAIPYTGAQPGPIAPGTSKGITINDQWNGRIFNQNGSCGEKGEGCTVLEYNLGKSFVRRNGIGVFFSSFGFFVPFLDLTKRALLYLVVSLFRLASVDLSIPH